MLATIGRLLPLALAVALSTTPILVTVLLLLSPKQRWSAPAFLAGWIVGLIVVTGAFTATLTWLPPADMSVVQPALGWVEIALGAALLGSGLWRLVHPSPPRLAEPAWLNRIATLGPVSCAGVGLVLNIRPKALVLGTAAGLALSARALPFGELVICILVYTVIGVSSVAVPVIMTMASPQTMVKPLEALKKRIVNPSQTVTVVVALMLGALILGDGMTRI
jgi:hypothetical protein